MSVIRHPALFERQTLKDGYTRLFRRFGTFEKILLIAEDTLSCRMQDALENNLFEVHAKSTAAESLRALQCHGFELIIFDASLDDFPLALFLVSVEKLQPRLLNRFVFLLGPEISARHVDLIERVDGLRVWRDLNVEELFQAIEVILCRK